MTQTRGYVQDHDGPKRVDMRKSHFSFEYDEIN